jgi:hypothetical protein
LSQLYLTRNASFEPSSNNSTDPVNSCLHQIEIAFRWGKPAIISSHRVNYIKIIDPENASNGLRKLDLLLSKILLRWPEVEFLTSAELGNLIATDSQ